MQKFLCFLLMGLFLITGTSYGYYYTTTYVPCSQTYGFGAISNGNGTCTCMNGYVRGTDMFGKPKCVNADQACRDQYGSFSQSIGNGYCGCMKGYEFEVTYFGKQCVSKASKCNKISNATYDYYTETCSCRKGYVFDGDKCKKATEFVFFLKEAKGTEAIIYNPIDKTSFKITLGTTCSFLYNDVGKYITIDIGYDDYINNGDTINYSNNRSCYIRGATKVSNDETLQTCAEIYGNGSIPYGENQCVCKEGYKWNVGKTQCIQDGGYNFGVGAKNDGKSTTTTNGVYENTTLTDYNKALSAKRALGLDGKKIDEIIPSFNKADPDTQKNIIKSLEGMLNDSNTHNKNFAIYFLYAIEHGVIE